MKPGFPFFDRGAHHCDDQLPLISRVGRGLRGDGYLVRIKQDSDCETYLEGLKYDAASKTYTNDWTSENINGGKFMYQYNLRPYTNPQTFTITFGVKRPTRTEWTWTTPAIPYLWDADNDGKADVDDVVGTGVADLFLKKTTEEKWNYPTVTYTDYKNGLMTSEKHDKLVYPDDWTRDMLNAPKPGDPFSVNLQYGVGGDIDAPNVDDIAKLLGITVQNVRNIIKNSPMPIETIPDENMKKYIDRRDVEDLKHVHTDLGFGGEGTGDTNFPEDGGTTGNWKHPIKVDKGSIGGDTPSTETTVKGYVDEGDEILRDRIKNLEDELDNITNIINVTLKDFLNKIYGFIEIDPSTGEIKWSDAIKGKKIPFGNINIFSSNSDLAILSHDGESNGDLKGE